MHRGNKAFVGVVVVAAATHHRGGDGSLVSVWACGMGWDGVWRLQATTEIQLIQNASNHTKQHAPRELLLLLLLLQGGQRRRHECLAPNHHYEKEAGNKHRAPHGIEG